MGDRLGEVFDGHISGVTEWGLYVELNETHCEGMIPVRDLDDDFYEFDEKNYCLIGRRRRHKYQLGDNITIQVARADLIKKQLDFVLVDERNPAGTHRIDKAPITQQSRLQQMAESKKDRQRSDYEGGKASRRQQRGKRGNSARRGAAERSKRSGAKRTATKRRK